MYYIKASCCRTGYLDWGLLAKDEKIDLKHHKRHSFLLFCAKKQERKNSWKTTNIGVATIEKKVSASILG
jgi:hypothetical protein